MESGELNNKKEIRAYYLKKRDMQTVEERTEKSGRILQRLKENDWFQKAEIILIYLDYKSEVITTNLVEEIFEGHYKKDIFCPRIVGTEMEFYEITGLEQLEIGYKGIREPKIGNGKQFTKRISEKKKCLIIMPGAVFDKSKGRMGYGKGYYDRFLSRFPKIPTAALAFDCQFAPEIPLEIHDICPDIIITESGIIS